MTVVVPLYRTTSRTVPWLSGKYQFTMPAVCGLPDHPRRHRLAGQDLIDPRRPGTALDDLPRRVQHQGQIRPVVNVILGLLPGDVRGRPRRHPPQGIVGISHFAREGTGRVGDPTGVLFHRRALIGVVPGVAGHREVGNLRLRDTVPVGIVGKIVGPIAQQPVSTGKLLFVRLPLES